jgi:hypothetical protein
VKVNTDAVFVLALHSGSGGAVLRNEYGELIRASRIGVIMFRMF